MALVRWIYKAPVRLIHFAYERFNPSIEVTVGSEQVILCEEEKVALWWICIKSLLLLGKEALKVFLNFMLTFGKQVLKIPLDFMLTFGKVVLTLTFTKFVIKEEVLKLFLKEVESRKVIFFYRIYSQIKI